MDDLNLAVIHDVKNRLAELALLLGRREDCARETGILMSASRQLTGLLLAQKQQAGLLAAHVDGASPSELLQELAAEYRVLFPDIAVNVDVSNAPDFWFYDAALIRLALANALHNGCRHAVTGVTLVAGVEDKRLVFDVEDDGPGFSPEVLSGHQVADHGARGTGLGLHLARIIAALHRHEGVTGKVHLVNRNGACFRLILP